jgi:hypothetical protein
MSKGNLQEALKEVNMTSAQLVEISDGIVKKCTFDIDILIQKAKQNVESLTNEGIRDLMLKIALSAYGFSEVKEKSALTAECAEIVRKEKYAKEFAVAQGSSAAARENAATLQISDEILVEAVYNLVSSSLKTKLDECHRVVDVLKTILMSRMSEAKLNNFNDAE